MYIENLYKGTFFIVNSLIVIFLQFNCSFLFIFCSIVK